MRTTSYAEIYHAKDGWRWRLKSRNHRVIAVGEGYTRKADAVRGAKRADPGAEIKTTSPKESSR